MRFAGFCIIALLASTCASRPDSGPVPANQALINGELVVPLDKGWSRHTSDIAGSHSIVPLRGGGVTITKYYSGQAELVQRVAVPSLQRKLTARLRLDARSNRDGYSSQSALVLAWLDSEGNELGRTVYALSAPASTQPSSNGRRHVINAARPGEWSDFVLDIETELSRNLTAFPRSAVRSVSIALSATCAGGQPC